MDGILQKFYILFETDAEKSQKKVEAVGDAAEAAATGLDAALQDANNSAAKLADAMEKAGNVQDLDTVKLAAGELEAALRALGDADPDTLAATLAAVEDEINRASRAAGTLDAELKDASTGSRDLDRGMNGAAQEIVDAARAASVMAREIGEGVRNSAALGSSFVRNVQGLANMVAGFWLVQQATQRVAAQFAHIIDLTDKASRYNFNIEGLQAFGGVLEDAGGNAQDAERYIRRFADAISTAFGDKASAPGKALADLGVSAANAKGELKDTEAVLLDLAGALEGVNRDIAINRLKDLGIIDPAMVKTVLAGRAALQQLLETEKAKGVVTAEGAARARELKMAMDDVTDVASALFNTLVARLGPGLTVLANGLIEVADWFGRNKTLVQGFGIGMASALAVVAAVLWGSYIPAWTAAAVATLAATWPVVAITAAVLAAAAAFALLWEDVQAFLGGQPSLLGDLISRYEWVRKGVDAIVAAWRYLAEVVPDVLATVGRAIARVFGGVWSVVGPVLALIVEGFKLMGATQQAVLGLMWAALQAAFAKWWPVVKPVFDLIIGGLRALDATFMAVGQAIGNFWGGVFDGIVEKIRTAINWVRALTGLVTAAREGLGRMTSNATPGRAPTIGALAAGQSQLGAARAAPLASTTSPALAAQRANVSRTTSLRVDKLEVHTKATDAEGMAKSATGALSSQMRRAHAEADDGVER